MNKWTKVIKADKKKTNTESKLEKTVQDFKNYLLEQRKKDIENAMDYEAMDYEIEMFEWENEEK